MKKKAIMFVMMLFAVLTVNAQAVIGTKTYVVDTLFHRQIGPGIVHTKMRLPEYPLNVYMLEVDMTHKYNRIETTQANNTLGKASPTVTLI